MKSENMANKIVNIYVLFLMAVFPLFQTNEYYNVKDDKLYSFLYATIVCIVLVVLCFIAARLRGRGDNRKGNKKVKESAGSKNSIRSFISSLDLSLADIFVLCFAAALIISTICSDWRFEAFWGNKGRYNGCFIWMFYIVSYFLISRLSRIKSWYINVFIAAGLIVCVWGILDFFYMSPIGWQVEHGADHTAFDFSSTLGNVNLLTSYEGMILLFSSALFIGNDRLSENDQYEGKSINIRVNRLKDFLYAAVSIIAFAGLICGLSDNAIISAAAAVCFLPFYAFRNRKSILKYLGLLTGWILSMAAIGLACASGIQTVVEDHWGELAKFCVYHTDIVIMALIGAMLLFAAVLGIFYLTRSSIDERKLAGTLRIIWAVLGIAAAAVVIYIFYDANHGGEAAIYKKYSTIFIFDNNWGNHRGFNWSLAFSHIKEFPIIKRLFGSGPETYYIYTFSYDKYAMQHTFKEMYDSPHSELIQYIFTTGIIGSAAYYGWVTVSIINGFRNKIKDFHPVTVACAYAVLVYTLVSFVNISTTVVEPVLILCIALIPAVCRMESTQEVQH